MISLSLYDGLGADILASSCNGKSEEVWIWNATDGTARNKARGQYLTVKPELEVWAGPLSGGSQAVLLLNRGGYGSEEIIVK